MGDGGDVLDHRHFQTHRLQGADGGLTALTGALHEDLDGLQTMLHRSLGRSLSCALGGEGRGLLAAAETQTTGGSPRQSIALSIGDGHHGVVEGRTDMDLSLLDVLLLATTANDFLAFYVSCPDLFLLPLLLLVSDSLLGAFASACVGLAALTANGQATTVAHAAIAADFSQTLDVKRGLHRRG